MTPWRRANFIHISRESRSANTDWGREVSLTHYDGRQKVRRPGPSVPRQIGDVSELSFFVSAGARLERSTAGRTWWIADDFQMYSFDIIPSSEGSRLGRRQGSARQLRFPHNCTWKWNH